MVRVPDDVDDFAVQLAVLYDYFLERTGEPNVALRLLSFWLEEE